jgi:hypothetical protein
MPVTSSALVTVALDVVGAENSVVGLTSWFIECDLTLSDEVERRSTGFKRLLKYL